MVIDYKRWVINHRMKELNKWLKYDPFSFDTEKRRQELEWLELELKDLDDEK